MGNRFNDLAIQVFRENETGIKAEPIRENTGIPGYKMTVRLTKNDSPMTEEDHVKLSEINDAIRLMAPRASIHTDTHAGTVTAEAMGNIFGEAYDFKGNEQFFRLNPIGRLAGIIADAGVNYQGSEAYRSRGLSPP